MAERNGVSPDGQAYGLAQREHAVVIGGSLAGLCAARVLAAHFARVTVVERDRFPAEPAFRKGVPQARHVHVLLMRGRLLLERLFPGLVPELEAAGARSVSWPGDVLWLTPAGWSERFRPGFPFLCCSRDLLEWTVREHLARLPGVRFLQEHDVTDLKAGPDRRAVIGVQVRPRAGAAEPTHGALGANLVVDASGRDSTTPRWLVALGYEPPAETRINSHLAYASRLYARPRDFAADWAVLFLNGLAPTLPRGGGLFPVEGDRWLVTLAGTGGVTPPLDDAGFLEYARSLRSPVLYEAIRDAEPLSPVHGYQRTENQMRHYDRLRRWPERLLVLGDAACAFNPIYGQGMTVAALDAVALHRCLREQAARRPDGDLAGLARRFQQAVARVTAAPWLMATGEDFRYPTTEGGRPGLRTRLTHRYLDRVMRAATTDPAVNHAFGEVMNLITPPTALFDPRVLVRVLRPRGGRDLDAPPTARPAPSGQSATLVATAGA
jgi:2-polyprenyl-6-methoxyphenol hydroxylase-like FAD-dependent oxidoreductase